MRTVPLGGAKAAGRVVRVDDHDYAQVAGYTWHVWERSRGRRRASGPYAITVIRLPDGRKRVLQMHRLLMPGAAKVDHRDGDGLNNQRYNLREATRQGNSANSQKQRGTSSRFKGVSWHSGKWEARIKVAGRLRYLGRFAVEAEAARAYDTAAREAFGEFARVNLPLSA